MSAPITITATVAAWMASHRDPTKLLEGKPLSIVNDLAFYGDPALEKFGNWIRVGDADVTVRLIPRDEQVRLAVEAAKAELHNARAAWLTRQQEILARINSLQALELAPEAGA